ncbi:MAG: 30S ribosomal protein S15 [Spirosomataceae bacterium]|jgi:small subunit ribosomal protein S15|nr:30S ribosomal protein S15 [Flectobacillus sp.]
MYLTSEVKEGIFESHGKAKSKIDTGSAESQIALFTHRISHLTQHLKKNHKDHSTTLGLLKLVGKRRALLDYLIKKDVTRYRAIIAELGIRK